MVIGSVIDVFVSDSLYDSGIRYLIEIKFSFSDLLIWAVGDPGFKPSQKQVSVEEGVWLAQMDAWAARGQVMTDTARGVPMPVSHFQQSRVALSFTSN